MNGNGRSVLLEQNYALCDNPIPMLYEKLDKAYPGSRFILTMLSDEKWLAAVECLWDPNRNPFYDWNKQPFSHLIHEALYGTRNFSKDVFLARYRRHNDAVMDYFQDRPQDLLVMKMNELTSDQAWGKLCGFLGKPVPGVPYPHAHKDQPPRNHGHWTHAGDL